MQRTSAFIGICHTTNLFTGKKDNELAIISANNSTILPINEFARSNNHQQVANLHQIQAVTRTTTTTHHVHDSGNHFG